MLGEASVSRVQVCGEKSVINRNFKAVLRITLGEEIKKRRARGKKKQLESIKNYLV